MSSDSNEWCAWSDIFACALCMSCSDHDVAANHVRKNPLLVGAQLDNERSHHIFTSCKKTSNGACHQITYWENSQAIDKRHSFPRPLSWVALFPLAIFCKWQETGDPMKQFSFKSSVIHRATTLDIEQQVAWNASFLQELPKLQQGFHQALGLLSLEPMGTFQPPASTCPSIVDELSWVIPSNHSLQSSCWKFSFQRAKCILPHVG